MAGFATKRLLILIGAAASSLILGSLAEVRAQDKTTGQARPQMCTEQYAPVCGQINGVTKTYSNACFARVDGAEVIAQGPCSEGSHN
jgi:hypothetical protein